MILRIVASLVCGLRWVADSIRMLIKTKLFYASVESNRAVIIVKRETDSDSTLHFHVVFPSWQQRQGWFLSDRRVTLQQVSSDEHLRPKAERRAPYHTITMMHRFQASPYIVYATTDTDDLFITTDPSHHRVVQQTVVDVLCEVFGWRKRPIMHSIKWTFRQPVAA